MGSLYSYSNLEGIDAVSLPLIHPKLILCSKRGSQMITGKNVANITVAGRATVRFLKNHDSDYRAYVIANDTHQMSYTSFKTIFEKASELLNLALMNDYYVALSCYAGINRSVTTILMYVIRFTDQDWRKQLEYIRDQNKYKRHKAALINTTFEHYLDRYAREF